MNATTQKFIEEAGITRVDYHWVKTADGITIHLQEDEECTPAELVDRIYRTGQNRKATQILNLLNPV